jgi:tetrahydromethanopterin S-methyltransferase subunit G
MIEAGVSAVVAIIAAGAALTNKIHNRITDLDKRLDTFELRVATSYVPKQDFETAVQKMEDHMIRIENKIDQIALRNS